MNDYASETITPITKLVEDIAAAAPETVAKAKEAVSSATKATMDVVRKHPVEIAAVVITIGVLTWWLLRRNHCSKVGGCGTNAPTPAPVL